MSKQFCRAFFSNTLRTITEVGISLPDILVSATGSVKWDWLPDWPWIVGHPPPGMAFAYGPLRIRIAEFRIGNRAVFYSAPILWFGAASCDLHYPLYSASVQSREKRPLAMGMSDRSGNTLALMHG